MSKSTNDSTILPRFTPLNADSQGTSTHNVLYYDSEAPLDAIYENITARLVAVYNLLECVFEFKNSHSNALPAIAIISSILLSDAMTLLEEFSPTALKHGAIGL